MRTPRQNPFLSTVEWILKERSDRAASTFWRRLALYNTYHYVITGMKLLSSHVPFYDNVSTFLRALARVGTTIQKATLDTHKQLLPKNATSFVSIPKKVGCSGRAREPIPLRSMKDSIIRSMNVFGLVASTLFLASSIARMTTNTFVVEPSDFEKSCKV